LHAPERKSTSDYSEEVTLSSKGAKNAMRPPQPISPD
jgi:hypothetical protein